MAYRSRTAEWFNVKIRYEKTMEDGLQKKVSENYVVDALSFTEGEGRMIEEMSAYISGEFTVDDMKKCPMVRSVVSELVNWDCNLHTYYADPNLGCGAGPMTGISRFFSQVDEGTHMPLKQAPM